MLSDRVKCAVPNPATTLNVGSTVTLGAAPTGFRSFLSAFGGGNPAYFVLSDGNGTTITGVWTVNATTPETATITEIIQNDTTGGTGGATFSSACVAWNALPAREVVAPRASPFAGLRNLIMNGNPFVNQRTWPSGSAVPANNVYTLDRWRIVTSGQFPSWTDSQNIRTVTAPAGGMEQVIDGLNIKTGPYVLNWNGTATATVNGASVAKKGVVNLTGGTNVTVRMTGGTWSELQLEAGTVATPFEQRPIGLEILLCQQYYEEINAWWIGDIVNGSVYGASFPFKVTKRITPTLAVKTASGAGNGMMGTRTPAVLSLNGFTHTATASATTVTGGFNDIVSASAEF